MRWGLLALLAACGRIGFDASGTTDPTGDGGDPDGAPVVPGTTIVLSPTGSCTRIAWSGSHIGAIWREGTNFGASNLWFAEAGIDGMFTTPPMQIGDTLDNVECPAFAFNGEDYLVALSYGPLNKRDIDTFHISPAGVTTNRVNVVNDSGDSTDPVIAIGTTVAVLAWLDQTGSNYNTKARVLALDGSGAQAVTTLSGIDSSNGAPHIAARPAGFTITWLASTPRVRDIDASGTAISPETPMSFAAAGTLVQVWTGSDLYGAWTANDQLGTIRFAPNGTPTSTPVNVAISRAGSPSIVWTGSEAAVLYLETSGAVQYHLARFKPTGEYVGETTVANATASFAPAQLLYANGKFIASFEANVGAIVRVLTP